MQECNAESRECSTRPLSLFFTKTLTAVKQKLQTHCATTYVGYQQLRKKLCKFEITKPLSNQQHQNKRLFNILYEHSSRLIKTTPFDIIDSYFFIPISSRISSTLPLAHVSLKHNSLSLSFMQNILKCVSPSRSI